jgi:hypothetical protein
VEQLVDNVRRPDTALNSSISNSTSGSVAHLAMVTSGFSATDQYLNGVLSAGLPDSAVRFFK